MQTVLTVRTSGPGFHEFTAEVVRFVREADVEQGLLTLFVQHTSCSLCIQENADPNVRRDLDEFFRRLVPSSDDPRAVAARPKGR
jgi:secondary thiamine-phosphate synthase enzyme